VVERTRQRVSGGSIPPPAIFFNNKEADRKTAIGFFIVPGVAILRSPS